MEHEGILAGRSPSAQSAGIRASDLLDASPQGILVLDREGTISYANAAAERALGPSLRARRVLDALEVPGGDHGLRDAIRRVRDGGPAETVEHRGPRGAVHELRVAPVAGGIAVYLTDVTATRRAEASERAARTDAERVRAMFERSPFPMALYAGPDHVVVLSNDAHARAVGRPIPRGARWAALFPELEGQGTREILDRVRSTRDAWSAPAYAVRIRAEDGTLRQRHFHVTYQPVGRADDGSADGVFMMSFEVTDLVAARRAVEEAARRERVARTEAEDVSRVKDEFLAVLSHELRTPLNAILGWSVVLQSAAPDPHSATRALRTIERNARQQASLIDDVLDIARITSGKLTLRLAPTRLDRVVAEAIEGMRPAADAKGVVLAAEIEDAAPIMADDARLRQVVGNLLGNAIKFTPSGGRIDVVVRISAADATVTVSDTGVGMSPEFLPHVFDRFRQADGSMTRAHGGLGLGLAIVQHIVVAHGGTVSAGSPGPGRGATLSFRLPVASARARISSRPPPGGDQRLPLEGLRVLVVDDDADGRELVATLCREAGAEVRVASSAAGARAIFRLWPVGIVVSDLGMPGGSGYELVRWLRESEWAGTRALALSAYAGEDDARRAADVGFDAHLAKPVDPRRFVSELARIHRQR